MDSKRRKLFDIEDDTEIVSSTSIQHDAPGLNFPNEGLDSIFNQFEQGDLIFGLTKVKNEVAPKLSQHGYTFLNAQSLNEKVVKMIVYGCTQNDISQLSKEEQKHYYFLKKHSKYLLKADGRPLRESDTDVRLSAVFRRVCKLILVNRDPKRTRTVHVLTKGLKWDRLWDKKKSGFGITDSEVRAAYRDFLKHGENPHIVFYNEKHRMKTDFPWNSKKTKKEVKVYSDYLKMKHKKTP